MHNWADAIKVNKTSQCYTLRCQNFDLDDKTCQNEENYKNLEKYEGYIYELSDICNPIYYIYLVLNYLNLICIMGIFILQSLVIVFKFYILFLQPDINEREYIAVMKDDKVVVHSS